MTKSLIEQAKVYLAELEKCTSTEYGTTEYLSHKAQNWALIAIAEQLSAVTKQLERIADAILKKT